MILRANTIIAPVLLSTVASLGYLAYSAPLPSTMRSHLVALGAVVASLGLQVPILPENKGYGQDCGQGRGERLLVAMRRTGVLLNCQG